MDIIPSDSRGSADHHKDSMGNGSVIEAGDVQQFMKWNH